MTDLKHVTQRLQRLPAEPVEALRELTDWLVSVHDADDLKPEQRARVIEFLDTNAQLYLWRASRAYTLRRQSRAERDRLWTAIRDFCRQDALALGSCIDAFELRTTKTAALRPMRPGLSIRALRAIRELFKCLCVRYGPVDEPVWQMASAIYALAERSKYSTMPYLLHAKSAVETTVEREYLRIAMFSASSPASLTPPEIEIAERVIASHSADFVISPLPQPGFTFWIDLATERGPHRYLKTLPPQPTLRFFSAAQAAEKVLSLAGEVMLVEALPGEFAHLEFCTREMLLSVLTHLTGHWSAQLLQRRHPRHSITQRLTVVRGFAGAIKVLAGTMRNAAAPANDDEAERWTIENMSASGIGARVVGLADDRLGVGGLLALRSEGAEAWQIGLIRRLTRTADDRASLGIELLGPAPLAVRLRIETDGQIDEATKPALLLEPLGEDGETRLVLPAGVYEAYRAGQAFIFDREGVRYTLRPCEAARRGAHTHDPHDYVLVRCEITRAAATD